MARTLLALAGLALLAGCGAARVPSELGGLWSAGPAACEAGVGVRFTAEAIEAVYDEQRETLFANPHYQVLEGGSQFRVRIVYDLPHRPGGARVAGAQGVLILARDGARIGVAGHNMLDGRTGAARLSIGDDPVNQVLALEPCGPHPWRGGLRGLT